MYLLNDETEWWICQCGHSGNFQNEFTCNIVSWQPLTKQSMHHNIQKQQTQPDLDENSNADRYEPCDLTQIV